MEGAVSLLSKLNTELDKLTADREKLTKPMNEALKEIRGRYKPFESQLEAAIKYVRTRMSEYQTLQVEIAEREQARIAESISDGASLETALTELEGVEKPDRQVRTESGMVSFRAVKKWRMSADGLQVPREYMMLNDDEITKAMRAGIPVQGIEYYTEQQPINRRA